MIDLHVHSTFSDGSLSPEELVQQAAARCITTIALTDHDTTEGVAPFLVACNSLGLEGISGVELSLSGGPGNSHLLGYWIDPMNQALQKTLQAVRGGRLERNLKMVDLLQAHGVEISWQEILEVAGDAEVVGRPHFAQILQRKGYVKSKKEAFAKLIGQGCPGYAERYRLSPEEGIELIHGAGGLAVLAHPFTLGVGARELREHLVWLKSVGLDGLEVYYSEHSEQRTRLYTKLTQDLGLLKTGGSDFHGAANPNIRLGIGFGNLQVPVELMRPLRERRKHNA